MRIPTIVLLSSVALSLLVSAENATPATVNANTNTAVVEATPEREAAPEPVSSLKMREDEKTYPVGNGIVFTKTTFFVDNNNNNDDDKNDNENGSKVGATGLLDDLLGGLLGIDIDIGGKKKKKKDPPTDSPTTTPKEETGYDYILLYGDDGYKPRPVPKGCSELKFMDQMIWDQQGNRGEIEDASGQGPQAITLAPSADAATEETDKKDSTEKKDSTDNRDSTDKSQKILAKIDTSAATAVVTDPKKKEDISDNNNNINAKKATDVDPEGIHICLLGPCKDDEEDREEEEEDDTSSKRRKIHHKQKKFLKKFRGKALKIDGRTGCPIPSEAA